MQLLTVDQSPETAKISIVFDKTIDLMSHRISGPAIASEILPSGASRNPPNCFKCIEYVCDSTILICAENASRGNCSVEITGGSAEFQSLQVTN